MTSLKLDRQLRRTSRCLTNAWPRRSIEAGRASRGAQRRAASAIEFKTNANVADGKVEGRAEFFPHLGNLGHRRPGSRRGVFLRCRDAGRSAETGLCGSPVWDGVNNGASEAPFSASRSASTTASTPIAASSVRMGTRADMRGRDDLRGAIIQPQSCRNPVSGHSCHDVQPTRAWPRAASASFGHRQVRLSGDYFRRSRASLSPSKTSSRIVHLTALLTSGDQGPPERGCDHPEAPGR